MTASDKEISWSRALLSGVVILIFGLGVTVWGADEIITRFTSLSRDNVSYLASGFFLICVAAAAWLLRRLQGRGVI